jgi:hypothetical protein
MQIVTVQIVTPTMRLTAGFTFAAFAVIVLAAPSKSSDGIAARGCATTITLAEAKAAEISFQALLAEKGASLTLTLIYITDSQVSHLKPFV